MKRARRKNNKNDVVTNAPSEKEYNITEDGYEISQQDEENLRVKYFGEKARQKEEQTSIQNEEENVQPLEETQEIPIKEVLDNQEPEEAKEETILYKNKEPQKKKKKEIKKYSIIFLVSLAVIILGSLFALSMGGMFNNNNIIDEFIEPVDEKMGKVNVLLLGVDKEGLRTDTIIIASVNMDENKVDLLSIPRDTRMYIGSRYQKINAAHAISRSNGKIMGPEGTIEAVTRLTGIPINYYVEFSFKAFRETIDALGGVYFDVPQNMYYKDPTQDLYINLKKGYQLLDGDKAEQLVRFRSYPEGDIKRVRVQQSFIKAVAEQKLNATILGNVPQLYKTLTKNIKTNLRVSDAIKFAEPLMNLNFENITMYELPGDYSGSEYTASYWLVDINETRRLVESVFGYDTTYTTTGKAKADAEYGREVDPERLAALLAGELDEVIERPLSSTPTPDAADEEDDTTSLSPDNNERDEDEDERPSQSDGEQDTHYETAAPSPTPETTPANSSDTEASEETQEPPRPTHNSTDDEKTNEEQTVVPEEPSEIQDVSDGSQNSGFVRPKPN